MRYAIQQADDAESPDFDDSVPKVRGFGDVDADMLADADDFGNARMPGTDEIKRRAATERGARCFFHGCVPPLTTSLREPLTLTILFCLLDCLQRLHQCALCRLSLRRASSSNLLDRTSSCAKR